MINVLKQWYERHFTDPQTVIFAFILISGAVMILVLNNHLMPILISIIVAYLFEGLVVRLSPLGINRVTAASLVTTLILAAIVVVLFVLLPMLSQQISGLLSELPQMVGRVQTLLLELPEKYPELVSAQEIEDLIVLARYEVTAIGQKAVSMSLASVVGAITVLVYMILIPLMVFFFLRDKDKIVHWLSDFLPKERRLLHNMWAELDIKIASYIRGKAIEILIIWSASFVAFSLMGLNYSMLLSLAVGLSVIIPYVGATLVTFPVALIAYFQWGFGSEFAYLMGIYALIQFLDGNLLVPLLFSEVVNLHPVAIIAAVVFFGSVWGVWGVFFAIPLATLIQAVIKVWPAEEALAE